MGARKNLRAGMVDTHGYWGNESGSGSRRVNWGRSLDRNDRALRSIGSSLGGVANGFPREDGFDIVVASEVMAIFFPPPPPPQLPRPPRNIILSPTPHPQPGPPPQTEKPPP